MVETEIERLKEEPWQQKDKEDRMRSQINRRLKQKTNDFEKLYRNHKQTEAEYKKLGLEFDQQQEKLKEVRTSIDDCSAELWMQWSQQAAELQTL